MFLNIYLNCLRYLLILFILSNGIKSELFSSIDQMEQLINVEKTHVKALKDYIQSEEKRLENVDLFLKEMKYIVGGYTNDVNTFLSHPINQHKLLQRFIYKWPVLKNILQSENSANQFTDIVNRYTSSNDDIEGAVKALLRLQRTYDIKAEDFQKGELFGFKAFKNLTSVDIFYIGVYAFDTELYTQCSDWMTSLLNREEDSFVGFTPFNILDYIAICSARSGDLKEGIRLTEELLKHQPDNARLQQNLNYYKFEPDKVGIKTSSSDEYVNSEEFRVYESTCRKQLKPIVENDLKCFIFTNHKHPNLILQPLKAEEVSRSPHLVRFYDFISEEEIEQIKKLAKPQLNRATVHNYQTGKLEFAEYRVSKSAWLSSDQYKVVDILSKRITHTTNLTLELSEILQIANYGIGGQYEPHYDYSRIAHYDVEQGNRIATMLMYLSDVQYGGNTAFIYPRIAVEPIKGSSVFWYNLLPSGVPDVSTRHAACPVLIGVKWVANQWIRERGQEFIRKCELDRNAPSRFSFT